MLLCPRGIMRWPHDVKPRSWANSGVYGPTFDSAAPRAVCTCYSWQPLSLRSYGLAGKFLHRDQLYSLLFRLKMLCLYLLGQNCLQLTFKPFLSSEIYSRLYENLSYSYPCMYFFYRKHKFVENVWPANSALFIYVSTHCVETVK